MAGGGSSREQNFWPGFVDALTNLVLVLVFVVVVFTFALFYFASQLAKQKIGEIEARYEKAALEKVMSRDGLAAMRDRRAAVRAEAMRIAAPAAGASGGAAASGASLLAHRQDIDREASQAQPVDQDLAVTVTGTGGAVVLQFAPGVADLSSKEDDAIDAALGAPSPALRYELTAEPAEPSPSEGRRLAYYRIAAVRNHLVAKGASPDSIDMVIGDPAPPGTSRSRVIIRTRPSGGK